MMIRLLFSLSLIVPFAQAHCAHQRDFGAEQDPCLDNAAPPPAKVLQAILQTDQAAGVFGNMSAEEKKNVAHLFHGTVVHLHNAHQRDMLVRSDYPMGAASNAWFWIVTFIDDKPMVHWTIGNGITIHKHKTNGYADISASGHAGVSTLCTIELRHNGMIYQDGEPRCEKNR